MNDYLSVFRDAPESAEYPAVVLEGALPPDLKGCLLRNGPGIQHAGPDATHLLDGFGFVAGLFFEAGKATFRARHVQTPLFTAERAAGKQLFRKPLTNLPKRSANLFNVKLGNPAGHDVYPWNGKLYASDAPGHFALDAKTLATLGPAPINALVKGLVSLSPMPRADPATGRLVTYSVKPGMLGNDAITFREYDAEWNEAHQVQASLPGKGLFLHDHAFSANHYVVVEFGRLKLGSALLSKGSVLDAIEFDAANPLRLIVIPRTQGGQVRTIKLPPLHETFHLFNAFERGDELVVDATMYTGRVHFHEFYPPALKASATNSARITGPFIVRHTLNLKTGAYSSKVLEGVRGEAPTINQKLTGQPHRYGYVASPVGRGDEPIDEGYFWFHGVAKVDFEQGQHQTWSAGPRAFASATAFVSRPNPTSEDDGWLLTWVNDVGTEKSQVVVLDAKALQKGPIARIGLEHLLPAVSHTEFATA